MNELLPEQLAKNYLENKSKKATYYNGDKILDIDITQSGIRSFEELLYNFYSKNRIAVKLKIIDENRGYPEYAKKWNGIEISRL